MNSEEIIEILDKINNYLTRKEYLEASIYIEKKKEEIIEIRNYASEYMDTLVKELK